MRLNQYEPFYNYRKTPPMIELAKRLEAAANSLVNDLQSINPLNLNISEYNQRYLKDIVQKLEDNLVRYADIVGSILSESRKPLADFIFIEYGGGTGFLSLLSKKLGVGTVIYNDIYDVSCKDAKEIAQTLGCQADYYVEGDIDNLIEFCRKHQIKADGIGSSDVIEHIYDIDDFLRKLHLISQEGTTIMHVSGCNMFFYPYAKPNMKLQINYEIADREKEWGHKQRDSLSAYSEVRRKIIREYCADLNEDETERMVTNTRGLNQADILKCVDRYIECQEFPKLIEHPTNTCDPYTGNWEEHFMNPYHLQETLSFNGFRAKVLPRYWSKQDSFLENAAVSIFNPLIHLSHARIGLTICPYFTLYANYSGVFSDESYTQHMYRCRRPLFWYIMAVLWEIYSRLRH